MGRRGVFASTLTLKLVYEQEMRVKGGLNLTLEDIASPLL